MPEIMHVIVPPGIGDFSWVQMKLCTIANDFVLDVLATDGGPGRLGPISEILPNVVSAGPAGMGYQQLRRRALPARTSKAQLYTLARKGRVLLEANAHLESGKRIEAWLPEIGVDYHFDIDITPTQASRAASLVPDGPFFCVFAANIHTITSWGHGLPPNRVAWTHHHWVQFMQLFRDQIADIPFVVVGVIWDQTVADAITAGASALGIKVINLCSQLHIGETVHVISLARYGAYFPSGLGVLAQVVAAPSTMFYADVPAHHKLMRSWADPELTADGSFNEQVFCAPAEFVAWLRDVYKLQTKL